MTEYIDTELLQRIGLKLWGPGWPQQMAAELQISERKVRRWARGTFVAPASLKPRLASIMQARGKDLRGLLDELNGEEDGKDHDDRH